MGLVRGPLRLGVGEKLVEGEIHQVLACGHSLPPNLDEDGLWLQEARCCKQCLSEFRAGKRPNFGLSDEEILAAVRSGDWEMTDSEVSDLVKTAQRPWDAVRYGRRYQSEQGAEGS